MNRKEGKGSALDIGRGCRCTDAGCGQGRQDTKHDRESSGHLPNGASINICPDSLFEAAQVRLPPEIAESPKAMVEIFHETFSPSSDGRQLSPAIRTNSLCPWSVLHIAVHVSKGPYGRR